MTLPAVSYTICRIDETGKYQLEDEWSVIMSDAHLPEVFREIEDREADEGVDLGEPDIHELELGEDD